VEDLMAENSENATVKKNGYLILALASSVLAVIAGISALAAGPGSRLGLWDFRTGFEILRYCGYTSIVAVLIAIICPLIARRQKLKCFAAAIPSIAIGMTIIFILANLWIKSRSVPAIHDITTDIVNPPKFSSLLPLRAGAINSPEYGGPTVAIKQLQAYPDIKPLVLEIPPDQAYNDALRTARKMGWDIIDADKKDGRIEATATTFWFGFTDDIVIRVTPVGQRSIIDMRSESRVGRSDLGKNAERIRQFLQQLHGND
jgi:uncharacterized protein (DUF1499 family)